MEDSDWTGVWITEVVMFLTIFTRPCSYLYMAIDEIPSQEQFRAHFCMQHLEFHFNLHHRS